MRYTLAFAGALLVACAGLSSDAQAEIASYPGSMCEPEALATNYVVTSDGSIYNPSSTSSLKVICPIVRRTATGAVNDVSLRFHDENTSYMWVCTYRCRDDNGTGFDAITVDNDPPSTIGLYQHMSLPQLAFPKDYGACQIACTIPPYTSAHGGSYLVNYVDGI